MLRSARLCSSASSRSRRKCGREASAIARERRHRHEAADQRIALDEAGDLVRRNSRLRVLSGQVHLEERWNGEASRCRIGAQRVDELAQLVHDLGLVRLQVPDEMPAEGPAVEVVLALEVLRAVLPHHLDAGFRERRHLLCGHVLGRDDDCHVRGRPRRERARSAPQSRLARAIVTPACSRRRAHVPPRAQLRARRARR